MNHTDNRPDPDELLANLQQAENAQKKGKLKIFFGMSPGVGKTYTMLQTARIDASKGVDVVVGYIEPHNRPETTALLDNLIVIPRKKLLYKGTDLEEMDLDSIIQRHPYLVLVDELAHTNAPGSRHLKRYQDVLELLDNGINVYTTVNVQHLESRVDTVSQITGITIRETLPDSIFESADEVELVDITPDELLDRMAEGKVYAPEQSKEALKNFFRKGNITALREMSLRMVADRVDKQLKTYMQQKKIQGPWKSGLHLMVLIGPSPSSAQLIRWAKNMAYMISADLTALHIENAQPLGESQKKQLSENIQLARQMGMEVVISSGNDLVETALNVARKENISHIIVGKSGDLNAHIPFLIRKNLVNRLIEKSGNIDVYVLGSEWAEKRTRKTTFSLPSFTSGLNEYGLSALVMMLVSLFCWPFKQDIGYQSVSFILFFFISILATFLRVGPILLAASIGALVWNFFFIPPLFTMHITNSSDILAFFMFFIIALVNGILTSKLRKQEKLAVDREERTNALFHLTKELSKANTMKDVIEVVKKDIRKYFLTDAFFILQDGSNHLKFKNEHHFSKAEYGVANWVFKHEKKAGKYTDTLPSNKYTYFPLKGSRVKPGVVAIKLDKMFSGEQELFWDVFITQISNAIEHQYLDQLALKASFLDESDRLYKTLFNSISHELRIPVATVMGASDSLLSIDYDESTQKKLCEEIFTASKRLNRLIDNLLNMSRLESGRLNVRLDWCDVNDLFNKVTNTLQDELQPFHMDAVVPDTMPLVRLDFGLMEQALYNLVYNSCQYAKPDTTIRLKAFYDNGNLILQEMDRGSGFLPDALSTAFNKFFRGETSKTGGLGLGLSIAKGFVEAHKGTIVAENRQNGGARFTIQIPTEISYSNE